MSPDDEHRQANLKSFKRKKNFLVVKLVKTANVTFPFQCKRL
jgi:hypothetical protein